MEPVFQRMEVLADTMTDMEQNPSAVVIQGQFPAHRCHVQAPAHRLLLRLMTTPASRRPSIRDQHHPHQLHQLVGAVEWKFRAARADDNCILCCGQRLIIDPGLPLVPGAGARCLWMKSSACWCEHLDRGQDGRSVTRCGCGRR